MRVGEPKRVNERVRLNADLKELISNQIEMEMNKILRLNRNLRNDVLTKRRKTKRVDFGVRILKQYSPKIQGFAQDQMRDLKIDVTKKGSQSPNFKKKEKKVKKKKTNESNHVGLDTLKTQAYNVMTANGEFGKHKEDNWPKNEKKSFVINCVISSDFDDLPSQMKQSNEAFKTARKEEIYKVPFNTIRSKSENENYFDIANEKKFIPKKTVSEKMKKKLANGAQLLKKSPKNDDRGSRSVGKNKKRSKTVDSRGRAYSKQRAISFFDTETNNLIKKYKI